MGTFPRLVIMYLSSFRPWHNRPTACCKGVPYRKGLGASLQTMQLKRRHCMAKSEEKISSNVNLKCQRLRASFVSGVSFSLSKRPFLFETRHPCRVGVCLRLASLVHIELL